MNADYRKLILDDEHALATEAFKLSVTPEVYVQTAANRHNDLRRHKSFRSAIVLSDGSRPGVLAAQSVTKLQKKLYSADPLVIELDKANALSSSKYEVRNGISAYFFVDTANFSLSQQWLSEANRIFAHLAKGKHNRCVVCAVFPEPTPLPQGVSGVSEREYDYLLENGCKGPEEAIAYALDIQKACRHAVRDLGTDLTLIRITNLFGPETCSPFGMAVDTAIDNAFSTGEITVTVEDRQLVHSCICPTDAVSASVWALFNGESGQEYNVDAFRVSMADIKASLFEYFQDRLSFKANCPPSSAKDYHCFDTIKFDGTCWKRRNPYGLQLTDAVARIASFRKGLPFSYANNVAVYKGKLAEIQALELQVLREIDRICKKHNIQYFLAGGSMLGSIRYGHSIPWDDDLDLGFLRKDFDKFRKVCDSELGPEYVHSCYYNGSKSHYVVDKIRLKNTYFSTRYSMINKVEDGIFVDLLVYDATSSIPFFAFIHDKLASLLGYIVRIHWQNLRRTEFGSFFTLCLYRFIKLFPISFWQFIFERVITLYRFKKHPTHVIDSTGKCIGTGTMKFYGLEQVKPSKFDGGFTGPIPADPTNYLHYAYGPNYISEPPYCKRIAPHNYARIDLGSYLFSRNASFRKADIRGELYELENH